MIWPVMNDALAELANTMASAISSGRPARFSGTSQEVAVPVAAIAGVFAKESGYGFAFTVPSDPVTSLHAATAPIEAPDGDATATDRKPRERPKHLQVVK